MSLSPGTQLGPYEVVAPLGAGGMGEVYRAKDPKLGREVAIKVLPEHPDALARFGREAKAVAALSHPNILAIFDFGEHEGTAYAVTELLEGETLRERLGGGASARARRRRSRCRSRRAWERRTTHRPPRLEARERVLDPQRRRQAARLRPGAPDRRHGRRRHQRSDADAHPTRHDPRHRRLHVSRAGARRRGGSPLRDGKYLVVDTQDPKTGFDVQKIDLATKAMTPVVHGPGDEVAPALSPDGKWLAYVSADSGAPEVYLTAFPSGEGKWQATGRRQHTALVSRRKTARLRARRSPHGGRFLAGRGPRFGSAMALPVTVASDRIFVNSNAAYAVTSAGRFITTQPVGNRQPTIHLITNWNRIVGR